MMNLKIFVVIGLLILAVAPQKYRNESWKIVNEVYDQCEEIVLTYPTPTVDVARNVLNSYKINTYQLYHLAQFDNSTILPNAAAMFLQNLVLIKTLQYTPENVLIEFDKVLPKKSAGLREIVSSLQCSIGKLTDNINDAVKCIERSLKHLLKDFLNNGVENLSIGRKTDFEPVMQCLQKLVNTIAPIAETVLNDCSLSTDDVYESLTILIIILSDCFVFVQGTESTIATIIHLNEKPIPLTLNACLNTNDIFIKGLTDSIRLLTKICEETHRGLLANLVSLRTLFNETLENVFGLTKGVTLTADVITQHLSHGISSMRREFDNEWGCQNVKNPL